MSERSLETLLQTNHTYKWEELVIYNTHPEEVNRTQIEKILDDYSVYSLFQRVSWVTVFSTNLHMDIYNLIQYARINLPDDAFVYIYKGDYILSRKFGEDAEKLTFNNKNNWVWTPATIRAKENTTWNQIEVVLNWDSWKSVGDTLLYTRSEICPHQSRNRSDDGTVLFISHHVLRDWNTHFLPAKIWKAIDVPMDVVRDGGWIRTPIWDPLQSTLDFLCEPITSFVMHQFHGIKSVNFNGTIPNGTIPNDGRKMIPTKLLITLSFIFQTVILSVSNFI